MSNQLLFYLSTYSPAKVRFVLAVLAIIVFNYVSDEKKNLDSNSSKDGRFVKAEISDTLATNFDNGAGLVHYSTILIKGSTEPTPSNNNRSAPTAYIGRGILPAEPNKSIYQKKGNRQRRNLGQ